MYEQEAELVAEKVMRMATTPVVPHIPREEQKLVQRKTRGDAGVPTAAPIVSEVLRSPGHPLDGDTRAFMEPRFGYDFSRVRVHSDSAAGQSARDVSANAYTIGHHIVFDSDRFAPATHDGRRLIAHELTHVVQQSGRGFPIAPPNSSVEVQSPALFLPVVVHGETGVRIAREPKKPGNQGIALEIELKPGMNANDVRRKVTVLDQLASRGRLVRAASPIKRQTVPGGVAREYGQINPKVSTEYKFQILEQAHKQIGPHSPNYEPVRWRKFFDLWARSQGDRCGSCPREQSRQGPAPQRRTFPAQDTHSKQGHAFANRFSRNWRLLEEEKERLRGYPSDQEEGAGCDCEHQKRAEVVILGLPSQRAPFCIGGDSKNFIGDRLLVNLSS
jgi:hypothetical protein